MCDRVIPRQSIARHNQSGVYLHTLVIFRILRSFFIVRDESYSEKN